MESLSLGVFKARLDVVLGDVVSWVTLFVGGWLDQVILEGFSNLNFPMILLFCDLLESQMQIRQGQAISTGRLSSFLSSQRK